MTPTRSPHARRLALCLSIAAATSGAVACAHPASRAGAIEPPREFTQTIQLQGHPLELHLAAQPAAQAAVQASEPRHAVPLVLYASGDGGWFGAAIDMFHTIAADGYPAVGISSKALLKLAEPRHERLHPGTLTADYLAILAQARIALGLPDSTPVVLTGWSRGASFAVIVAAQSAARPLVRGVVAIGMTHGENLRFDDDADDGADDGAEAGAEARAEDGHGDDNGDDRVIPPLRRGEFDIYAVLRGLRPVRSAVIQATHDNYLPAARARRLFGDDTVTRRLFVVDARNHRFSGGREAFHRALQDALHWTATANGD